MSTYIAQTAPAKGGEEMLRELCPKDGENYELFQDLENASKHDLLVAILVEVRNIEHRQLRMLMDNAQLLNKIIEDQQKAQSNNAGKA